ncbi:MAG TPA: acyl carrier protein [Ktedonobacterales bacterium]|nr:acyl carrier protein [Ktedonobacterales bacterium]
MDTQTNVVNETLIREQLRDFLQQNFLYDGDVSQVGDDESLLERGIVDSTGVLELVLFAEETYDITVDSADLLPENFDSINSLTRYVAQRMSQQ